MSSRGPVGGLSKGAAVRDFHNPVGTADESDGRLMAWRRRNRGSYGAEARYPADPVPGSRGAGAGGGGVTWKVVSVL